MVFIYGQLYVQSFLKCGSVWTKRNIKSKTKQKKCESFQKDFFHVRRPESILMCSQRYDHLQSIYHLILKQQQQKGIKKKNKIKILLPGLLWVFGVLGLGFGLVFFHITSSTLLCTVSFGTAKWLIPSGFLECHHHQTSRSKLLNERITCLIY